MNQNNPNFPMNQGNPNNFQDMNQYPNNYQNNGGVSGLLSNIFGGRGYQPNS
jgi:hypothetical protein